MIGFLKLATENPVVTISYGKCINTSVCFGYVWCPAAFLIMKWADVSQPTVAGQVWPHMDRASKVQKKPDILIFK